MVDINELNDKLVSELREIAHSYGVENADGLRKQDLIKKITEQKELIDAARENTLLTETIEAEGEKPRKRARTVKSKTEDTPRNVVSREETPRLEFPVQEEAAVSAPIEPATAGVESRETRSAAEPRFQKFEKRGGNVPRPNETKPSEPTPAPSLDFDNVIARCRELGL